MYTGRLNGPVNGDPNPKTCQQDPIEFLPKDNSAKRRNSAISPVLLSASSLVLCANHLNAQQDMRGSLFKEGCCKNNEWSQVPRAHPLRKTHLLRTAATANIQVDLQKKAKPSHLQTLVLPVHQNAGLKLLCAVSLHPQCKPMPPQPITLMMPFEKKKKNAVPSLSPSDRSQHLSPSRTTQTFHECLC